jgi:cytochrome c oxidase assembly factor CtaG
VNPAPSSFTFEPLFLALAVAAAVLYFRAARAERPPLWRIVLFSAGLLLIAGALN